MQRKTTIEPSKVNSVRFSAVDLTDYGFKIRRILMDAFISTLLGCLLAVVLIPFTVSVTIATACLAYFYVILGLSTNAVQLSVTDGENQYIFTGAEDDLRHVENGIVANME